MGGDTQHIRERGMHTRDRCREREREPNNLNVQSSRGATSSI